MPESLSGTQTLSFNAQKGTDNNVYIDKITITKTPRLTKEYAAKLDADAAAAATNNTNTTKSPAVTSSSSNGAESTTTEAPVVTNASSTTEIVLICVVIILIVALIGISVKYYQLRQEMVGNYSVSATNSNRSSANHPAFDNPLYSGQHTAASDRYGSVQD